MLSLLATIVVISVFLRPPEGWIAAVDKEWARLFPEPRVLPLVPHAAPTPNEPVYEITADFDEKKGMITGRATVKLPELHVDDIPFYLYTAQGGSIQVRDVMLNGAPAQVKSGAKQFVVQTGKSVSPQTVSFAFETRLPMRPTRAGIWQGVSTVAYWYPILAVEREGKWMPRPDALGFGDPYLMDVGTYRVEWNAPAGMKWYSSGVLVQETDAKTAPTAVGGGRTVYVWKAEKVRHFAMVGGRRFQERVWDTGKGTKVYVATLDPKTLDRTFALAKSSVTAYSDLFGLDLHPVLHVLELPKGTIYAHELPNMALFSQDLWGYPGDDPEHWIAHEIGHVWFYSSVGNYETETPWLDEGLADYAALLEEELREGPEAYRASIAEAWKRFEKGYTYTPYRYGTQAGSWNGRTDAPYGAYGTSQAHYYYNYLRPVLMYHDLRRQMGEAKFFLFLKQYYVKNRGATATRAELEQALQDVDAGAVPLLKLWLDAPNEELISQVKKRF